MADKEVKLFDATIKVTKRETAKWDAPDGKSVDHLKITDEHGQTYSVWNPRYYSQFSEGKQVTFKYSKRGNNYKVESVAGLEQEHRGKGRAWKEQKDYSLEHLGRLQNTLIANKGTWDAETEKVFTSATEAYFKAVSRFINQTEPSKEAPKLFRQTNPPIVEPTKSEKAEARKLPLAGASSYVPKTQGELIGAALHFFDKNTKDIASALNQIVPTSQQEIKEAWNKLVKAWS